MAASGAAKEQDEAFGMPVHTGDGAGGSNPPDRFVFKVDEWAGEGGQRTGGGKGAQGHQIHTPRAKGAGKGGKNNYDARAHHRNTPGWALWEQFQKPASIM